MSRNTNNSKSRALNNDIAENDNRNASDVASASDTLPQPAPAPNIQGTAVADEGHVSQREFNDFRNEVNDFRDEMRNNHLELKAELKDAIAHRLPVQWRKYHVVMMIWYVELML